MKINKNILILSIFVLALLVALAFCLKKILPRPKKEVALAKVAIVIDDWGYNLHQINLLKEIDVPITISILPNLRYSSEVAKVARDLNQEVILHLPLEPEIEERKIGLEEHTITSNMTEEEIIEDFKLSFSSVPYACGVSNHMGSRATKDKRLMSVIFAELKRRKLFFLDNLVTTKSVCKELAKQMKVEFASRDVFLDNLGDYEYIKGQFKELSEVALRNSYAVGIAHAKQKSLEVLKEQIPLMQAKGIKFVFVSDLVK